MSSPVSATVNGSGPNSSKRGSKSLGSSYRNPESGIISPSPNFQTGTARSSPGEVRRGSPYPAVRWGPTASQVARSGDLATTVSLVTGIPGSCSRPVPKEEKVKHFEFWAVRILAQFTDKAISGMMCMGASDSDLASFVDSQTLIGRREQS